MPIDSDTRGLLVARVYAAALYGASPAEIVHEAEGRLDVLERALATGEARVELHLDGVDVVNQLEAAVRLVRQA
jgi:hypothetical protein